ncbi:MAG: hypothetical protein KDK70_21780 [Myxococcales bacterium]|nr:hypothetical protein [Myxococcales bacterium]
MAFVDKGVAERSVPIEKHQIRALMLFKVERGDDERGVGVMEVFTGDEAEWPVERWSLYGAAQRVAQSLATSRGLPRVRCELPIYPDSSKTFDLENLQFAFARQADC